METGSTVGEVARVAGVTVRTLHHWDAVGLLRPSGRSAGGYRVYDGDDLARLQRVLAYRELGFGLEETAALLDDPEVDELEQLRRQRALLVEQRERLGRIITTIETTMEARTMGIRLTPAEMLEVFGGDPTEHAAEAEERWGDTDAHRESAKRTSTYTKADWQRYRAGSDDLVARMAEALRAGVAADSVEAMDLAEEHRRQIEAWFYACGAEMHRGLGDMYVADERFAASYEPHAAGLTRWLRDAIHANADRQDG